MRGVEVPRGQMAIRVDREVRNTEGINPDGDELFRHQFDPDVYTVKDLVDYVRGHWQVENSLHFILDRWWDQDRHYSKRPGLAERRAAFQNMALTLLRLSTRFKKGQPIRARADELAWTPAKALEVIGLA